MNKKNRNSVILGIAGIIFTLIMFGVLLSILIEPTSVGLWTFINKKYENFFSMVSSINNW